MGYSNAVASFEPFTSPDHLSPYDAARVAHDGHDQEFDVADCAWCHVVMGDVFACRLGYNVAEANVRPKAWYAQRIGGMIPSHRLDDIMSATVQACRVRHEVPVSQALFFDDEPIIAEEDKSVSLGELLSGVVMMAIGVFGGDLDDCAVGEGRPVMDRIEAMEKAKAILGDSYDGIHVTTWIDCCNNDVDYTVHSKYPMADGYTTASGHSWEAMIEDLEEIMAVQA